MATEKSKTALYHGLFAAPHKMTVLKENEDGTVDVGENGKTIVRNCPVAKKPTVGHVTMGTKFKADDSAEEAESEPLAQEQPTE